MFSRSESGFMAFSAIFTSLIVLMATPSSIVTIQHDLNQAKPQAISVVAGTPPKANANGIVSSAGGNSKLKPAADSKSTLTQTLPAFQQQKVNVIVPSQQPKTAPNSSKVTNTQISANPPAVETVQAPAVSQKAGPQGTTKPAGGAAQATTVPAVSAVQSATLPEVNVIQDTVPPVVGNTSVTVEPVVKHTVPQASANSAEARKVETPAVNAPPAVLNDVQPVVQAKNPKLPKVTANGWIVTDISEETSASAEPAGVSSGKPSAISEPAAVRADVPAVRAEPAAVRQTNANVKNSAPMPLVVALEDNLLKPIIGIVQGIVSFFGGAAQTEPEAKTVMENKTAGLISAGSDSPKNIFAIGEQKSQTPTFMEVNIYTDKGDYWVGETINVTITAVNKGSQATLDRYVLINDGTRFYYFDGSTFTTKVSSFRETYKAGEPKSKKIISYKVSDADPAATFTLYAGFTMAGTADIVSNVSSATFKIKGGSSGEENKAPSITVASNFPASVKRGQAVTFTANWSDPNQGEKVKLLVCRNSGRSGQDCRGDAWCTADYSPDNPKTCRKLIPEDMAAGNYDYFAFVCDDGGLCSDYKKGTFNVDAGQPPQNQPPSVTSVYSSPEPIPLNTNVTFTVNWFDPNQGDRVKTLICGTNALNGTNCSGAGQEWCTADYSSSSPGTCTKFFPPGSSLGQFTYYAFACDDDSACSQSKAGTITIIDSHFRVSISPSEPQSRNSGVPATFTAVPAGGTADSYLWSISPGTNCAPTSSTGPQFTVTCTNAGSTDVTHQVSVTAWSGPFSASASTTLTVNGDGSGENTKPTASFIVTPESGVVNETAFAVDASSSSDEQDSADKLQVRWQWESGGNFTDWAPGKTATHIYSNIGTKKITLEVRDSGLLIGTTSKTVEVLPDGTNTAPTAAFTVSPSSGVVNERLFTVDASYSSDAEDSVDKLQVHWKWGDGTESSGWSTEKSATHTYNSEGAKTITLEVKDTGNLTATASTTVEIFPKTDNQAPVACFEVNRDSGSTNTYFRFDAICTYDDRDSDENLNYKWDWDGDGKWDTTSTAASRKKPNMPMPTLAPWYKKYSTPGTYNVRLEVTDPNGLSDTASETITVVGGIPNSAPKACLEVDRDSGTTETHFHFDASCTYDYEDPEGILNARWDWEDDGTWDVGYNNNLKDSKKFSAGTRTIRFEVKDTEGLTDQATVTITVTPPEQPKCSDIYVRTEDVSLEKGETANKDWLYENYSNEKFYVDSLDIDYISGSQYFTAEKRPPYFDKEISAHGGAGYYLRIIGKNVNGTQSGAATVKVSGHFAGGTGCSVEESFAVEVVDKESGTLPKCSDIYVNAENVTVNEGETSTETFYYRNNSKKPFYVDDIEAGRSSSGAYFEVSTGNNSGTIYAQGQANYSLNIRGNQISGGDKSGSAYVQVKGHFEGGKSCDYDTVGTAYFTVDVHDSGSTGGEPGGETYCSHSNPCGEGEGDCKEDNLNCESGLACIKDVGSVFGYPSGADVCVAETTDEVDLSVIDKERSFEESFTGYSTVNGSKEALPLPYVYVSYYDNRGSNTAKDIKEEDAWCMSPDVKKFFEATGQAGIPHWNIKIYYEGTSDKVYNLHVVTYKKNGKHCVLLYEPFSEMPDDPTLPYCVDSCGEKQKNPREYIKSPPVKYPVTVPYDVLDRAEEAEDKFSEGFDYVEASLDPGIYVEYAETAAFIYVTYWAFSYAYFNYFRAVLARLAKPVQVNKE